MKPSSHLWVSSWEITCCKDRTVLTAPRSLRAACEDSGLSSAPREVPQPNSCPEHVSSPGMPITSNHGASCEPAARITACSNTCCSFLGTIAGALHRLLQPLASAGSRTRVQQRHSRSLDDFIATRPLETPYTSLILCVKV